MIDNKYRCIPFWSWNGKLTKEECAKQIKWMHDNGIGGFFMHARAGLQTKYLSDEWFDIVDFCVEEAEKYKMYAYAYDENGWPSGFVGGELLKDINNRDCYIETTIGEYDSKAAASYDISTDKLIRVKEGHNCLNLFITRSTSTADVCDKNVVRKFMDLTHEKYKARDKKHHLKGFFTDEPQYYRQHTPFTYAMVDYYKETYNEDVFDSLGLLVTKKEGYKEFRYRYYKAMQHLMLNAFSKQIYDWCTENDYIFTGHYVEETRLTTQMWCCAGCMPFYEYETIPGMDWLGRHDYIVNDLGPKQLVSACAQLGKKQILTETFACTGWDATPEDLKHIAEYQYVNGVNLMCTHLLPYSETKDRKRDYPCHFTPLNEWCNTSFKEFNDYFTELGYKLANSKENIHIALFHPIRSCYLDYDRVTDYESVKELEVSIDKVINDLASNHIPYHFIDETILEKHGSVKGNNLVCGLCSYDVIIFPKTYTMDKVTYDLLSEYVKNGGRILFLDDKPSYIGGVPHSYNDFNSNITFEEVKDSVEFTSSVNPFIRVTHRVNEDNRSFFFIVNRSDKETEFTLNGHNLFFKGYESKFIYEDELKDEIKENKKEIKLNKVFNVDKSTLNYMTLDFISYSFDNKEYKGPYHHMGVFNEVLKARYEGDLYLKYSFTSKVDVEECYVLIEENNISEVSINGEAISKWLPTMENGLRKYVISNKIKKGNNDIILKVNYHQNDNVYYVLFGENIDEALRNMMLYDVTIEAIYLMGKFGVYGDIKEGKEPNVQIGENFYLDNQKYEISSLINEGYPFFRGSINLSQDITLDGDEEIFTIKDRFQDADIYLNDKHVGHMMFNHEIGVKNYVKKGNNNISIRLSVSNRNLLGPFHTSYMEEPLGIGPATFERPGTWENGKSSFFRDSYSFLNTFLK